MGASLMTRWPGNVCICLVFHCVILCKSLEEIKGRNLFQISVCSYCYLKGTVLSLQGFRHPLSSHIQWRILKGHVFYILNETFWATVNEKNEHLYFIWMGYLMAQNLWMGSKYCIFHELFLPLLYGQRAFQFWNVQRCWTQQSSVLALEKGELFSFNVC